MENHTAQGQIQCRLQVVTHVHIGCDEVYEPTGFVVDEEQDRLVIFDPTDFIQGLETADREQFSAICRKGTIESILEAYRFLRSRPAEGRAVRLCHGFKDHYRHVLELTPKEAKSQLNRFEIRRTAFCPVDNRPYIPGSAIKGALRTAYLNRLASKNQGSRADLSQGQVRKGKRDDRHITLESKLLGLKSVPSKDRISKDPFRMVKVSDFVPVGKTETKVMYAVNWKKNPLGGEGRGPYQMLEVVVPGAFFVGEVRVDIPQKEDAVSMTISLKELFEGCRVFYQKEKTREDGELRNIGCKTLHQVSKNGALPIRLGHHSGAECVTIQGYREIWVKGKIEGRSLDHATTLWLASEIDKPKHPDFLVPFGWAAMEALTPDEMKVLIEKEAFYKEDRNKVLRKKAEAVRTRLEKEKEESERLEKLKAEAEAQKAAEEKRKAELETMSREERAIAELQATDIIEKRVVEIYVEMQQYPDSYKKKAALALKEYWRSGGKWTGKQSNKQKEKIRKIKAILKEE